MTWQKNIKKSRRINPADLSEAAYLDGNGKHIQQKTGHTPEDSTFQIPTQQQSAAQRQTNGEPPSKRNTIP